MDDLVHFFLVFALLSVTLAFTAMWQFGESKPEFASISHALYTQVRMVIGDFPFPDATEALREGSFLIYLLIYIFLIFFTLMNFFLGIIVDTYAEIKALVVLSEVENTVFMDYFSVILYEFYYRTRAAWPHRKDVIRELLSADMDDDGVNDEEQAANVVVVNEQNIATLTTPAAARDGTLQKLFPCPHTARDWLEHYAWLVPPLDRNRHVVGKCEKEAAESLSFQRGGGEEAPLEGLVHSRQMAKLRELDILRARVWRVEAIKLQEKAGVINKCGTSTNTGFGQNNMTSAHSRNSSGPNVQTGKSDAIRRAADDSTNPDQHAATAAALKQLQEAVDTLQSLGVLNARTGGVDVGLRSGVALRSPERATDKVHSAKNLLRERKLGALHRSQSSLVSRQGSLEDVDFFPEEEGVQV